MILRYVVLFRFCSTQIKGPKSFQENMPQTITLPPPAWRVVLMNVRCMLSCYFREILTLPSSWCYWKRDSSDHMTFFQCSTVQTLCSCANLRHFILVTADSKGVQTVLWLPYSIQCSVWLICLPMSGGHNNLATQYISIQKEVANFT